MSQTNHTQEKVSPDYPKMAGDIAQHFANGGTLKELFGYTQKELEAAYTLGHSMYQQERYKEALRVFAFLMTNDHLEPRYLMAFASCCQMLKRYEDAIQSYSMVSIMDMRDPLPTFRTAECMIALGMVEEARQALGFVIEQSKTPEHEQLKLRAEAVLTLIQQTKPEATKNST